MNSFDTDKHRFFKINGGSKHMAQGPQARRKMQGRRVGAWMRFGDDPWVWVVWPDGEVRASHMIWRDYDAELDHPIV